MALSPLISVIVPCYNQAEYMDECLQSVLDQTYTNWECIIVNDGSPDHTEEIALQWRQKDPRFKYLKKENGGLSSARNAGIEVAKGEWILPLDSDDKIGNCYLELAQLEFNKGYTIIYCEADFFGDFNQKWNLPKYNYHSILQSNLIFCSALFKKKDWKRVGGYDINLIYGREDWDFWLSIISKSSKIKRLDYLGFFYRRKQNSMDFEINSNREKLIFSDKYIFKKHISKYLDTHDSPIESYKEIMHNLDKYLQIKKEVSRNLFTNLLYKLIKILN